MVLARVAARKSNGTAPSTYLYPCSISGKKGLRRGDLRSAIFLQFRRPQLHATPILPQAKLWKHTKIVSAIYKIPH